MITHPQSLIAGVCLVAVLGCRNSATLRVPGAAQKEAVVAKRASGTFEVKLTPQAAADKTEESTLARMVIDKQFHGDLEAVSKGEMLAAGTAVKGSAGYVAIEHVRGCCTAGPARLSSSTAAP